MSIATFVLAVGALRAAVDPFISRCPAAGHGSVTIPRRPGYHAVTLSDYGIRAVAHRDDVVFREGRGLVAVFDFGSLRGVQQRCITHSWR